MQSKESDINEIMEQIVQFSEDRDWDQFHNGKDLALALSIEASELNESPRPSRCITTLWAAWS